MCFGGSPPPAAAPAPPPAPAPTLMQSAPGRAYQDDERKNKGPKRAGRTPTAGTKYRTGAPNPLAIATTATPGITTRSGGLGI